MPASKSKMKYIEKYRKQNCKNITLRLNTKNDVHNEILNFLNGKKSKNQYIRNLIIKDMKEQNLL